MAQRKLFDLIFSLHEEGGYEPGDVAAHRAALAMGDRFDAPTIIALTDAMTYLQKMGGQLELVTIRQKVDAEGRPVGGGEQGEWLTSGMTAAYETRDAKIQRAKPITEALGFPVESFDHPATEVEFEQDPEPESDPEPEQELAAPLDEPVALAE